MADKKKDTAAELLKTYQVDGTALFVVGTFDTGVTVYSQQIRALNMVWAAVESDVIPAALPTRDVPKGRRCKIAIIGAGFAGLSVAAGLLSKGASAQVTLFEQRDALLPLQQGSDSRWLHPRIYDWPAKGSEASVAMLPVLNWTAARASDVVVQVLADWKSLLAKHEKASLELYCNARHLQIHEASRGSKQLTVEWVGERRKAEDGTASQDGEPAAVGRSSDFDLVILAVGFGLERDGALSYWRNETIGQPSLDQPRRTFMVSGQGDGAMIDVLRLRIAQYRQDRILDELFNGRTRLLKEIQALHAKFSKDNHKIGLFSDLEALQNKASTQDEFNDVKQDLFNRLRRDTDVILHLQVKKLSQLFDPATSRISFQNKLLLYFLYKCGGFVPSALSENELVRQHGIHPECVVRRHGTRRDEQLRNMLSEKLYSAIETRRGNAKPDPFTQIDRVKWPGGYFDVIGSSKDSDKVADGERAHWRREYLPGPTQLVATTFCATLAGVILARHRKAGRLRVTLHRAMVFGDEELLQQACDYQGTANARGEESAAARTFPAMNGTIGLAYRCQQIVRSVSGVDPLVLNEAMKSLSLNTASRKMSKKVGFVLALPLLEPVKAGKYTAPSPVIGVIYIDSTARKFFLDDGELEEISSMATQFLDSLIRAEEKPIDRIRNIQLVELGHAPMKPEPFPKKLRGVLEFVESVKFPRTKSPLQINYDYSDFLPIRQVKAK